MKTRWLDVLFSMCALCGVAVCVWVLSGLDLAFGIGLATALAIASRIDAEVFILPDVITLPLVLAGLVLSLTTDLPSLLASSIGAVAGYGVFWAMGKWYERLRGHAGLGLGDAKLMAGAGAWCGWAALPLVTSIGAITALAYVGVLWLRGQKVSGQLKIPFGPFLAFGFFCVWVAGRTIPYVQT